MDTRTGQIHQLRDGETLADLERRLHAKTGDLVMLDKLPEGECRHCHGTGKRRAGMFSRRFKPCRCTKAKD
jgi:hypothetical protein